MSDASPEVYWTPQSEGVAESISIALHGQKRFFRIWPGKYVNGDPITEWGWSLHPTAVRLHL